jgi:F-type H+-transporting ATPase subunit c
MIKKLGMLLTAITTVMLLAPAAFAQADAAAGSSGNAKGLMGIAAFGCGLGQGRVASAACEGMARNPGAAGAVRTAMILGLVFIETLALFTLVIIFVKVV